MIICWIFVTITFGVIAVNSVDPTISVHVGSGATVTGIQSSNPDGFVFLGIPYAQPPTGSNRFGPTQCKDLSGNISACNFGSACLQGTDGKYDEDCLFLNIWTPKMTNFTANKYPVLLYIHGGGLVVGEGNLDSKGVLRNLVSRDIIVITINYRLGIFGYFSTRDSTVPGNMGILDQIEALNWVKRYILYFGGDPNAITIDGESSGASSVCLLTLSPLSKGLIKGAIAQSGSAFDPDLINSFLYSPTTDVSKLAAIKFGCITAADWDQHNTVVMAKMLQCLQSKNVTELQAEWGGWTGWPRWTPVMDKNVFPDLLENLMLSRPPIPAIHGNCNNESLLSFVSDLQDGADSDWFKSWTRQFVVKQLSDTLTFFENSYNNTDIVRQQAVATLVNNMPYNNDDHANWVLDTIQIMSGMQFATYRDAMNMRQTGSPVYLYSFDYLAPGAFPLLNATFRGVPHTWDLQYLFGYPGRDGGGWTVTQDDNITMNYFGLFWANFVKYGNPTPAGTSITWPKLGTNGEYLSIGPVPTPSTNYHPIAATFWACTVPAIEGHKPDWCVEKDKNGAKSYSYCCLLIIASCALTLYKHIYLN